MVILLTIQGGFQKEMHMSGCMMAIKSVQLVRFPLVFKLLAMVDVFTNKHNTPSYCSQTHSLWDWSLIFGCMQSHSWIEVIKSIFDGISLSKISLITSTLNPFTALDHAVMAWNSGC